MRVSTSQIFQTGTRNLLDGQSNLYKIQNQLSTGKRFVSAQDDPVAAAQVVLTNQSLGTNNQYADNQSNASSQLAYEESRVQAVVKSVQDIMEKVVAGGNGAYSDTDRKSIAIELQSQFDLLLGLANSKDTSGYYLFSGYQGNTQPFQMTNGSVTYVGDDGQRLLQVGSSRQIAVSDSGRDIFEKNRTGNGTFALSASSGNTGTGVMTDGSVLDLSAWTGETYQIDFIDQTNYTVSLVDNSTVPPTLTAVDTGTYAAGGAITEVPGISFSISGAPGAGDSFTVAPSTNQSVFTTLQNLITAFSTGISGNGTATASFQNTLNAEMKNLDGVLNNVLSVRASVGTRMAELDSLSDLSESLDLVYQERLSNLQELDYVEAISAFLQQQTQLEAAQSSFSKISGMSLFNYI